MKTSIAIRSDAFQKIAEDTLHDKKAAMALLAELSTIASINPALQEADPATLLSTGLLAQSLNLSLAPALGYAYAVPFKQKVQFQIGWKGLVALAQRSGQYQRIGVRPVHEGEYIGQDEFGDDLFKFSHEFDNKPVVGYYAYFKLLNGFQKTIYWTVEQCKAHGLKYSQTYRARKGISKWDDEFDAMAMKTVLKQLLSKWGPLSIEMQKAVQADQAVVKEDGSFEYVDNVPEPKASKTAIDVEAVMEATQQEAEPVADEFGEIDDNAPF